MKVPSMSLDEAERVKTLLSLDVLYTPAEERFDRITRLARRVFDVPIVLISFVSSDKQWFKSCQGLIVNETGRDISFCGHAILQDDVFVVPNALNDPDFSDNPLVTGEPKIRFYAGQPLQLDGHRLGTLCIIDKRPRQLKPQDYDSLKSLATWVELELRAWHGERSPLIDQFLGLDDRESLVDQATGHLNETGIAQIKANLQNPLSKQTRSFQITAVIKNIPEHFSQESIDMSRKALMQCAHSVVADRGIIGQHGDNGCIIIFENISKVEVKKFIEIIGGQYVAFVNREFDLDFAKPSISLELKSLNAPSK